MEEKRKSGHVQKKNVLVIVGIIVVLLLLAAVLRILFEKPMGESIVLGVNTGDESFGSTLKGRPVPIGNLMGVVTGGNFIITDENGEVKTTENFVITDPVIHSKGNYTIAADLEGDTAKLYEKGDVKATVTATGKIKSVVTNANGFFAIATKETGYDAVITVYRKSGEAIYRYRITDSIFLDMDISANNRKLVVLEANLKGGTVGSNVVLVEFNRENAESVFYEKGNMYIDVHFNKNGSFVCLGNEKCVIYRPDGSKQGEIGYNDRKLIAADIATDDMICLGFEAGINDGAGTSGMEIYDKNGKKRGEITFEDTLEHISVNGKYVAVSHGDSVDVVKSDGKVKMTFEASAPVRYGVPFEDGKAVVVFSGGNTVILK